MAPPPSPSPELDAAAAAARSLPIDAIFEILSRTPIKSLCRFRCASREWNALVAGPAFLAAHKSRAGAQAQHLLAARYSGINHVGLLLIGLDDGKVLREIKVVISSFDRPYHLNLFDGRICLLEGCSLHAHMVDVATGEVLVTAQKLNQITSWLNRRNGLRTLIGAGHAALSGALKVVRLSECFVAGGGGLEQVCEVLEVDRGAGGRDRCWWRDSHSPPTEAGKPRPLSSAATVDGVVHFLTIQNKVLRFDLESEQWKETMRGPLRLEWVSPNDLRLAELGGALCMVGEQRSSDDHPCTFVWILTDSGSDMWVKAYTIPMNGYVMPLTVTPDTDGGGKLIFMHLHGRPPAVQVYDPRTGACTKAMEMAGDVIGKVRLCRLQLEHFCLAQC